jgi:hypothetical protein
VKGGDVLPTETVIVLWQPEAVEYEMIAVPPITAVTSPVEALTVATDELELLQVPPAGEAENVIVSYAHIVVAPVMADGVSFIV